MSDFTPGDKVAFDVEGSERSPFGFGTVTRVGPMGTIITPDNPIDPRIRMINVRAAEEATKK